MQGWMPTCKWEPINWTSRLGFWFSYKQTWFLFIIPFKWLGAHGRQWTVWREKNDSWRHRHRQVEVFHFSDHLFQRLLMTFPFCIITRGPCRLGKLIFKFLEFKQVTVTKFLICRMDACTYLILQGSFLLQLPQKSKLPRSSRDLHVAKYELSVQLKSANVIVISMSSWGRKKERPSILFIYLNDLSLKLFQSDLSLWRRITNHLAQVLNQWFSLCTLFF